ncbi:zf-HC2 domain-containing protein [Clostridium sartagoforme]|uniref:Zf-HC2 domain-containing protein n=1 Tax=Clostridium sartagoforme TaxID=84031 RepID=A0A4S2DPV4_9CLOT|nr:zf-HC2 domain-containing protein [Clostridium sartagoforme]TGY44458.1 zf-HC2 domain-containing protein [Clostridium sartagoforme]
MKINCTVIKDILPLYVEEMVSEDTRVLIENHIDECIDCKKEVEEMKTPPNIPIDINTTGFKNVKSKLYREKFNVIIFSIMLTMIISILVINYLSEPNYIQYSNDIVSINTKDNGEIFADFGDKVSSYNIYKDLSEDGSSYNYRISTWETLWDKLFNNREIGTVVLNPNGEKITSIYYYSAGQSNDILIYGKNLAEGDVTISLPRLFLAGYLGIAIVLTVIFFIVMLAGYKSKRARNIISKILIIPISYVIGTICIKGFNTASYSATRDFFVILLISIPIYFLLLIIINFYKNIKHKSTIE